MSVWDSVGITYLDAAKSALPLHRLAIFAASSLGWLAAQKQTYDSIFLSIAHLPLTNLAYIDKSPLKDATISFVLAGVFATFLGWALSHLVLRLTFLVAAKTTDLWTKANDLLKKDLVSPQISLQDRKTTIELLDVALAEPRARIKSLTVWAELTAGLSVSFGVASYWGNALDIAIAGGSFIFLIVTTAVAGNTFLRDYYGGALFKAQLNGKHRLRLGDLS